MSESTSIAGSAKNIGDAAALSLIDIRRIDRTAKKGSKRGDLTEQLRRRANEDAPPAPAIVAQPETPTAAPPLPPAPELPPIAAFAPDDAPGPVTRHAAALPEPYVAPSDELAPSYIVGAPAAVLPSIPAVAPAPAAWDSAPLPYDDLRSTDDLVYYWDELRGGRELPLFSKLDRTRIAISWPDTVIVNYDADRAAVPEIARLSRLTGVVEFTSMVTEWILSCSRQVARLGKAMETKRDFAGTDSLRSYHMLLLPFATSGGTSDHVLCHLSCAN